MKKYLNSGYELGILDLVFASRPQTFKKVQIQRLRWSMENTEFVSGYRVVLCILVFFLTCLKVYHPNINLMAETSQV